MEIRENYKDIELGGRKWRIGKFNARTGSFILLKVIALISPIIKSFDLKSIKKLDLDSVKSVQDLDLKDFNFTEALAGLNSLPEEEFKYIQDKCLGVCCEMLPSGPTPVLNSNGTFGVLDLEYDVSTVMGLTVQALVFNIIGFFGGSLLGSIKGAVSNSSPPGAQT